MTTRRRPSLLIAAVLTLAGIAWMLASCASPAPTILGVRVFVDRDENHAWSEGDIPLPNIQIVLDDEIYASTDEQGLAEFGDVTQQRHAVAIDTSDLEELESHALACSSASRSVTVESGMVVEFCFVARSFLEVDVSEDRKEN